MGNSSGSRVIAITGAAGYIGSRLLDHILEKQEVLKVIAIDNKPIIGIHPKLIAAQIDINASLDSLFLDNQVDTIIHLAFVIQQLRDRSASIKANIEGTYNLLSAVEKTGVKKLIYLSSSTVYGALPDNLDFLTENDTPRPSREFHYAWDKRKAEIALEKSQGLSNGIEISILRSSIVMGPNAQNSITDSLSNPFLIGIRGSNPQLQFTHESDLVEIIWQFIAESHTGIYNIAGPGSIAWSEVAKRSGTKMIWLSPRIAYGILTMLWKLRVQNKANSSGLDYIRWPWLVSTKKIEDQLKYRFMYTSADAFDAYVLGRGLH